MTKPSQKEKSYTISELASEFEISPRSIRFYEEKGLIAPRRTRGNQRIYSRRDRARLKLILRGKRFGYSLDEIAEMIGMTNAELNEVNQIETSLAYGEKKLREIRERIGELQFLEQDILMVREKLLKRLKELRKGETHESGANDGPERKKVP
ncbi:MAG: MerR family DNA-binding transcriptional regulator [Desulfomonilaceae bacterium]